MNSWEMEHYYQGVKYIDSNGKETPEKDVISHENDSYFPHLALPRLELDTGTAFLEIVENPDYVSPEDRIAIRESELQWGCW